MRNGVIRRTTVRADGNRFIVTLILTVASGGSPRGVPHASEPGLPDRPPIFRKPAPIGDDRVSGRRVERDRKSTRLNSSHSQISYAVFCLKKKMQPEVNRRNSIGDLAG